MGNGMILLIILKLLYLLKMEMIILQIKYLGLQEDVLTKEYIYSHLKGQIFMLVCQEKLLLQGTKVRLVINMLL